MSSSGLFSKPCSSTLATYIVGFIVSRNSGRSTAFSSSYRVDGAHGPRVVERRQDLLERIDEALRLLGFGTLAGLRDLGVARHLFLDRLQVGERELGVDDLDVGDRIDLARDVDDVGIVEAAHDVRDRVALADVREELVAQSFALARAGDQSGDVDELDGRGDGLLRLGDRGQRVETRIGDLDDADVGLDRAEGIVLGRDSGLGEGVEERRLADVGQADDAAFQRHRSVPVRRGAGAVRANM